MGWGLIQRGYLVFSLFVQVPFLHAFLLTGGQSLIAALREDSTQKRMLNTKTAMSLMLAERNLNYFSS